MGWDGVGCGGWWVVVLTCNGVGWGGLKCGGRAAFGRPMVPLASPPQALFNPYNLHIVPHHQINHSDYFTMSAKGVTHIINSEADFTPLKQWEREHAIFHNIFEIPFFQKFRRWKTFYFWKKYIRKTTIDKYKDFLEENLFILNKDLCPNLIKVSLPCPQVRAEGEEHRISGICRLYYPSLHYMAVWH